jgi:hypothetical protein
MEIAMSEFAVRSICDADHDAWMPLWRGYEAFYRVGISDATSTVTGFSLLDTRLRNALARRPEGRWALETTAGCVRVSQRVP